MPGHPRVLLAYAKVRHCDQLIAFASATWDGTGKFSRKHAHDQVEGLLRGYVREHVGNFRSAFWLRVEPSLLEQTSTHGHYPVFMKIAKRIADMDNVNFRQGMRWLVCSHAITRYRWFQALNTHEGVSQQ